VKASTLGFDIMAASWILLALGAPAMAQTPEIDCQGTLQAWAIDRVTPGMQEFMATHHCSCPCNTCEPNCTAIGSAPAAPWSGSHVTHATSSQMFAAQMVGEMIGQIIASAFAEPKVDEAALAAQKQKEEEERKKAEAEKQKLLAAWKAKQAQAEKDRQAAQAQNQQAGNDLLNHMQTFDGTGASSQTLAVEPVAGAFGTMQLKPITASSGAEFKPMSRASYDTSGLKDWQRALCAAYLSQSALSVVRTDPEQARYFDDQAALAMSGQPIEVRCQFPKMAEPPQPQAGSSASMDKTVKAIEFVQARAKDLQDIETKLQKAKSEKSGAESMRKQAEEALAQAQTQKAQAKPDDAALLAEIARKINEAQCQLNDANNKLDALSKETDELYQQKESIRQELQNVQQQVQGAQ
jgi:hypothetical protein